MPAATSAIALALVVWIGPTGSPAQQVGGREPAPPPAAVHHAEEEGFPAPTPVRQSRATTRPGPAVAAPLTLRDAATGDRWFGQEVRDVRWAPDGSALYFRWHPDPAPGDDPEADPWFRVDRDGRSVERVPDSAVHRVPGDEISWSRDGRRAAWVREGGLYVWEAGSRSEGGTTRLVVAGSTPARRPQMRPDGSAVHFMLGEDLHAYQVDSGAVVQLTRRHVVRRDRRTEMGRWLEEQQMELMDHHRRERDLQARTRERERARAGALPQPIPVEEGARLDRIRLSPDGRFVTFSWTRPAPERRPTVYADHVTASGYVSAEEARSKVGEPRDQRRLGIVRHAPGVDPDSVEVRWIGLAEAEGRPVVAHGPWWSLEGDRAAVQLLSEDHKDLWIGWLDPGTGHVRVIDHQHDPAWLGGPPIQGGRLEPALLEWLPGGRMAFASERTGWSHLYVAERDGSVRALTGGAWEVREAALSRDRTRWILSASREHPADDHVYVLPASGGEPGRLTQREGRSVGVLSPDGERLALVHSDALRLPDLFLMDPRPGAAETRVTESGSERARGREWVRPEIVSFAHPDGSPVWAALFKPREPHPHRAAVLHIHGGGYRQFAHRGWSVYGWANHVGFIQWLVQQGYTVLDFDYRGGAGFGRDYRTDIHRSMGVKDVDGAVAAVDWLAREHGVDRTRVGLYGVSYGGFFTLMSLFRHPGVFAAGVSNDGVTDWAHYSDGWTSRILNLPYEDPEAYRTSSPIHHAGGLADPLLLVHSLIDDNVHFQDAARLVHRLIELEKTFDVMIYPLERHNFRHDVNRYDYYRRVAAFFERHLLADR